MDMLDKRLNDKGKNWRHVLKALKVLDYCLHEGSELVVTWAKQNLFIIKTLREFQYIDEDGRDVGQNGTAHQTLLRGRHADVGAQFGWHPRSLRNSSWTKNGSEPSAAIERRGSRA